MTLYDLKGVIDFTFDIADDEIDASFHIELDEIRKDYAKEIEVSRIGNESVTCKLTDFLRKHRKEVAKYLIDNYWGAVLDWLKKILVETEDITYEGGEAVFHFIKHDMYYFLTGKIEEQKQSMSMYEVIFSLEGISDGPEITVVIAYSSQDAVDAVKRTYSREAIVSRVMKYMADWK